jgi:hypothetical protein
MCRKWGDGLRFANGVGAPSPTVEKPMSFVRSAALTAALLSGLAFAAAPKSYQVTGEVVELTDDVVTVLKGKEKFEVARGEAKPDGDLKKGSKVTVEYKMTATSISLKKK